MSHWSKDAIVDRVESIVTDLSDKELINLIIEYRLILGIQDRDDLLDLIADRLFKQEMNEGPY
tara:strand:- start:562 stop:750 length:189 start_codon:yes stop_codon:yes gene_type:complete